MGAQTYRLTVEGELDDELASAFPEMTLTPGDGATTLTGALRDESELNGVIKRLSEDGLTLTLLEVKRSRSTSPSPPAGAKRTLTRDNLLETVGKVATSAPVLLPALVRPTIPISLREKIMLAVSSVNECRYCQWGHTYLATAQGVSLEEINQVLGYQSLEAQDDAEAAAILFAEDYAENLDRSDPAMIENLRRYYSDEQVAEILAYVRAITLGNLTGNSLDALLDRVRTLARTSTTAGRREPSRRPRQWSAEQVPAVASFEHGRHKPIVELRRFVRSTADLARQGRDIGAIWFGRRLEPAFREEIMVAVANANSSRHCSFAHREWALGEGLPKDELAAVEGLRPESLDARTWAAIRWARAVALSDLDDVPADVDAELRRHFDLGEREDLELVVQMMTWLNETSNTVDAFFSRLFGRPVPGSSVLGEATALLKYAIVGPLIIAVICVKQRRDPISVIADLPPFFREFEAKGRLTTGDAGT